MTGAGGEELDFSYLGSMDDLGSGLSRGHAGVGGGCLAAWRWAGAW